MDRLDWQGYWRVVEVATHLNAGLAALTGGSWLAYAAGTAVGGAVGLVLGCALGFALGHLLTLLDELRDCLDERRVGRHDLHHTSD